jgi:hypothetical protein
MRRLTRVVAMSMLALAVAGCSGDGTSVHPRPQAFCADEGTVRSDIHVNLHRLLAQHPPMPLNVETCVKGRCVEGRVNAGDSPPPTVEVYRFHMDATRQVEVHFIALNQGQAVFDGTTTVRLHRGQNPTNQGCSPSFTWFAQVSPHGDSTLRQVHVTYDEMYGR